MKKLLKWFITIQTKQALLKLSDKQLEDIGYTRESVMRIK